MKKSTHEKIAWILERLEECKGAPMVVMQFAIVLACIGTIRRLGREPLAIEYGPGRSARWNPYRDSGYRAFQKTHDDLYRLSPEIYKLASWLKLI